MEACMEAGASEWCIRSTWRGERMKKRGEGTRRRPALGRCHSTRTKRRHKQSTAAKVTVLVITATIGHSDGAAGGTCD